MTKWISDGSVALREVHGSRSEQHTSVGSNPIFNVTLECPASSLVLAKQKLLGVPATWPITCGLDRVKCIAINVMTDSGKAVAADSDLQIINYTGKVLLQCTYMPRVGRYLSHTTLTSTSYVEDSIEPRYESRRMTDSQLIWGGVSKTYIPPASEQVPVVGEEVPMKPIPGFTLTHLIEACPFAAISLIPLLGTTNNAAYTSAQFGVFDEKTLMLRAMQIVEGYSFVSYRAYNPISEPLAERPTMQVRAIYEWKEQGWNRFWRTYGEQQGGGYYYVRYAYDPFDLATPVEPADHSPLLDYA